MKPAEEPTGPRTRTDGLPPQQLFNNYTKRTGLIAATLIVGAVFLVWGVGGVFDHDADLNADADRTWVDLSEPLPSAADDAQVIDQGPVLRIAIAPVISPEKSLGMYRGLVDYISTALSREPVFLRRESYAEVNDLVRHGLCDLAFVCTYAYVRGEREFGMELLVVPEVGGTITYRSFIIVSAEDDASSLLDLRDQSFASADIMSNTGWLYPFTWLREKGEDVDQFFSRNLITGSHDRSIRAVANGLVDGAAVDSIVYEHMVADDPSLAERTKVILKSPPFGMPPFVVPAETDPALVAQLREALLHMHETDEGSSVLSELRITRFRVPDPTLYDAVRGAVESMERR